MFEFVKAMFLEMFVNHPEYYLIYLFAILINVYYKDFRGFMGEFWVKLELSKLPKDKYLVLNNIMVETNNGTHQIDHLVISKYGIFVIEMKNYYGLITGNEYSNKWTQHLGKNKYYFNNPIHQNYGHIQALKELLMLEDNNFISIICVSNQAKIKVNSNTKVVYLDYLIKTISEYNELVVDNDINEIYEKIVSLNIKDRKKRKKHVEDIKENIKVDNEKVDNMICPKCGGNLIERNGKYGKFIGCSNYPKCRYIKK